MGFRSLEKICAYIETNIIIVSVVLQFMFSEGREFRLQCDDQTAKNRLKLVVRTRKDPLKIACNFQGSFVVRSVHVTTERIEDDRINLWLHERHAFV